MKVVAKALALCAGKGGGAAKHKSLKNYSSVALQYGHARALARTGTAFGVACVTRPEQRVRSTPLLPCAMPKDGKRGRVCAVAVRWGVFGLCGLFFTFRNMDILLNIAIGLVSTALWEAGGYLHAYLKKTFFSTTY